MKNLLRELSSSDNKTNGSELKILALTPRFPETGNYKYIFTKKLIDTIGKYTSLVLIHVDFKEHLEGRFMVNLLHEDSLDLIHLTFNTDAVKAPAGRIAFARGMFSAYRMASKKLGGNPDVIHVHHASSINILRACNSIRFFIRKPYIITEYFSTFTDNTGVFESYNERTRNKFRSFFNHAEVLATPSNYLKEELIARGLHGKKQYVIPLPVFISQSFEPAPSYPPFKAVTISNLKNRVKNITGLIDAANIVSQGYDFRLEIAGTGEDEEKLRDYARKRDLLDKVVFFKGQLPNEKIPKFISNAHFFALNSNFETFSVATAEALSCGRPVVVTRCGGPEDFVTEECGLFVEPNNSMDLAKKMIRMIKNYESYDAKAIQKYAQKIFSPEEIGRRYFEIFSKFTKSK